MTDAATSARRSGEPELVGVESADLALRQALEGGRLHHGWLLCGPQGVGKASFAYRAARELLTGRADDEGVLHHGASRAATSRMIAARSHPDLLVLERDDPEGAARKSILVDEARRLPEFFSKSPAIARRRVAIVDAADDLNANAANAVLKTLEEPSGHGVLLLVSHAPGRLLPTIRSRCRTLNFPPWPQPQLVAFIGERLELDDLDAGRLARLAHGAPGRALKLAAQGALELEARVRALVDRAPLMDLAEVQALGERCRGAEGAARFALLMEVLAERVREVALAPTASSAVRDAWAALWDRLAATPQRVEGVNLDRVDAVWSAMLDLQHVARAHPGVSAPC